VLVIATLLGGMGKIFGAAVAAIGLSLIQGLKHFCHSVGMARPDPLRVSFHHHFVFPTRCQFAKIQATDQLLEKTISRSLKVSEHGVFHLTGGFDRHLHYPEF
jgi:ABC-type branched-subunit amino acid transport system permease subunit